MHGRLPSSTPDEIDEGRREVCDAIAGDAQAFRLTDDRARLEEPFKAALTSPEVGLALQELGTAVRYHISLTDRVSSPSNPMTPS